MSALAEVTKVDVAAVAGALNSSGMEIARWLELQLNGGQDTKTSTRLFSEAQLREMWTHRLCCRSRPRSSRSVWRARTSARTRCDGTSANIAER
jgi:hypothetical protein